MRRWIIPGGVALFALGLGCHHEFEKVPLADRTIYVTDRFYDVQALGKERALVVGYGGKILETTNGGRTWTNGNNPSSFYGDTAVIDYSSSRIHRHYRATKNE